MQNKYSKPITQTTEATFDSNFHIYGDNFVDH